MDLKCQCPGCGQKIGFPDNLRGQMATCPVCSKPVLLVPVFQPAPIATTSAPPLSQQQTKPLTFQEHVAGCGCLVILAAFGVMAYCHFTGNWGFALKPAGIPAPPVANSWINKEVTQVKEWIKANANDPSSVEFVEWGEVSPEGAGFKVRCKFRAKNGFGALVLGQKEFHMDASGKVTSVTEF